MKFKFWLAQPPSYHSIIIMVDPLQDELIAPRTPSPKFKWAVVGDSQQGGTNLDSGIEGGSEINGVGETVTKS